MSTSEEECPVCMEKICNSFQPSQPCCGKVICQRCLNQSFQYRPHCPYCRSQQNIPNSCTNPLRPTRRRHMRSVLPASFQPVNSRPVQTNIQSLLSLLQNSQTQQTDTANHMNALNQTPPPNQAPLLSNPGPRPVAMPRIRFARCNAVPSISQRQSTNVTAAPNVPFQMTPSPFSAPAPLLQPTSVTAAPNGPFQITPTPFPAPASLLQLTSVTAAPYAPFQIHQTPASAPVPPLLNTDPFQDNLEDEILDWSWQTEILLRGLNQQPQGFALRTFVCPYCQDNGFDQLQLLNHCNAQHTNDSRRVVCPVCAETPHGDPQYYSRNFIGHLNQRHRFYLEDITPLQQTDEVNLQCAIMASYQQNF